MPVVSDVTLLVPQPEDDEIAESGSVTVQPTETLLVYQPLFPSVPLTLGVITGGVESAGTVKVKVTSRSFPVMSFPSCSTRFHVTLYAYVPGEAGAVIVTMLFPLSWIGLGLGLGHGPPSSAHDVGTGPIVVLVALSPPPGGTVELERLKDRPTLCPLSTC